jgi:tetratricopeptide (TPR) repeat protein
MARAVGGVGACLYALDARRVDVDFWAALDRTDGSRDYCAEAVSYYEEALLMLSRVLPPKHHALLTAKSDLARILTDSATAESLSETTYARGVALYASVIEELCARVQVVRSPELVQLSGHQITLELLAAVTSPARLEASLPALSSYPPVKEHLLAAADVGTKSAAGSPADVFEFPGTVSAIAQRCSELAALHTKAGRFQEAVELYKVTLKVLRRHRAWVEPPGLGPGQALVAPSTAGGRAGQAAVAAAGGGGGGGGADRGTGGDEAGHGGGAGSAPAAAAASAAAAKGAPASASATVSADAAAAAAAATGAARLETAATARTRAEATAARRTRRVRTGDENSKDLHIAHVLLSLGQQSANLGVSLREFNVQGSRSAMVEALACVREAMELFRMLYSADDHPMVMVCLRSIAAVHAEQGKSRTARAVYDKILELYRAGALTPLYHPSTTPLPPLSHPSHIPLTSLLHPSTTLLHRSRVCRRARAGRRAVLQSRGVTGGQ